MTESLIALWAQHAPLWPVVLPLATALVLLALADRGGEVNAQGGAHDPTRLRWRRRIALASTLLGALSAVGLLGLADRSGWQVYPLGDWPAPFGIVLVLDRLSALMVVLTYAVALPVLAYACGGWDARGRHFHALFQFQLMGLGGAFVTGDAFNLFVFFEVLLVASYVLLAHGQGPQRFKVAVPYVTLNLVASGLFLLGLAMLYALTGTLNLADLGERLHRLPDTETALAHAAGMVLLVVFGFKAALLPLHLWLPATYAAASAPVAALFAIMTKVGVYAIVRVHWTAFGGDEAAWVNGWTQVLLPLGLATSVLGVFGALAAGRLSGLVAWLTVSSSGTLLAAVGLLAPEALSAALYYLIHSTVLMAALFLLVELVGAQRGPVGDGLTPAWAVREPVLLGGLLLLAAASAAGLPPLPGFLGKVMLLQASSGLDAQPWVWAVLLGVGFLSLLGLARAGVVLFWHVAPADGQAMPDAGTPRRLIAPVLLLLALGLSLAAGAQAVRQYTDAAVRQLLDREGYAQAVLGPWRAAPQGAQPPAVGAGEAAVRPYRGDLKGAVPAAAPALPADAQAPVVDRSSP